MIYVGILPFSDTLTCGSVKKWERVGMDQKSNYTIKERVSGQSQSDAAFWLHSLGSYFLSSCMRWCPPQIKRFVVGQLPIFHRESQLTTHFHTHVQSEIPTIPGWNPFGASEKSSFFMFPYFSQLKKNVNPHSSREMSCASQARGDRREVIGRHHIFHAKPARIHETIRYVCQCCSQSH